MYELFTKNTGSSLLSSLGQILLDRGWITASQLEQAIERQQQLGGRLGTCFLELGLISEEFLIQALSEQLGVPLASGEDLKEIPPEALALLPTKTAIQSRAVPFRIEGGTVDIAMLDVGDLTLEDEISFIVSKRVRFHVATELRLAEALAKYYGCNIPLRLATLAQRLSGSGKENSSPSTQTPVDTSTNPERHRQPEIDVPSARRIVPRQALELPTSIPLSETERAALSEVREQGGDSSSTPQESFSIDLVRAETSSDIGAALLNLLTAHFVHVLLFRVSASRQEITGWLAGGPDIDSEWFENYSIGLRQSSIFRRLLSKRTIFQGHLTRHPAHEALARCWGGSLDYDCLFMPVFVREKLVCVAYCDRSSLGLEGVDADLIERIGSKAAIAFERCILRHKLQTT